MPRSMIDYAVTALLVLYVTLMAVWLILLAFDSISPEGSTALWAAVMAAVLGWHLLKRKRAALQTPKSPAEARP